MTADVETKTLVADGAGDPAHVLRILFHHYHRPSGRRELVRCRKACWPCPDYYGDAARSRCVDRDIQSAPIPIFAHTGLI